jgi:hypothetical protein
MNAPERFQRLTESCLAGLDFVAVYLNDVLVFSNTEQDHCEHAEKVLQRLQSAELFSNP